MATASPRARLLWADDLAGQRVVVAAPADGSGSGGTLVRVWAGSRGADPASLTPVELVRDRVALVDDVVALAVEAGVADEDGAGAVLLLARPMVLQASYSALVSYERHGEVGRRWTEVALRDGVATVSIRGPMPPTFRVRVDGYDGGPLGVVPLGLPAPAPSAPLAESLLEALGPFVAACTGLPGSAVRSTVALEAPVAGDVLVPAEPGERVGRGRVVVALTTLPNDALLRTVRVVGDGRGEVGPLDLETTRVVGCGRRGRTLRHPAAGVQQWREPVPRGRSRRRPRPAGRPRRPPRTRHPRSPPYATAPGCWRSRTPGGPRSTGWSSGTATANGWAGGRRCSAAATPATCGRGCGDDRVSGGQRPWFATAAAAAAAASGSRYSPGPVGMKSSPSR